MHVAAPRIAFDLIGLAVVIYLIARAWRQVQPRLFGYVVAGFAGPLVTYLLLVERGLREQIHLDTAYACIVIVLAVRTKGDISRVAPAKYLRSADAQRSPKRVKLGFISMIAVLGLFFLVDYLSYGTILA